jgi:hypothetical protein
VPGFKDDRAPLKRLNTRLPRIAHWLGANMGMLIDMVKFSSRWFQGLAGRSTIELPITPWRD